MLPPTVFAAEAALPSGIYEISAAEVFADGFSFRVSEKRRADIVMPVKSFTFTFYDLAEKRYDTLTVGEFGLNETAHGLFRFSTRNKAFRARLMRLCREYLGYIDTKLNVDESGLEYALTGRKRGESYSESISGWRSKMLENAGLWDVSLLPCDVAVCLNEPAKWNDPGHFFGLSGLAEHPVSALRVTHAYIGSSLCPRLFPDDAALERVMEYCDVNGIKPVFCFPPMPERETDAYLRRAEKLPRGCETEINDIGTALMLRGRGFEMTAGVFLNRRKKDPRAAAADYSNGLDAEFYRDYLENLGISRFSCEAEGFPERIKEGGVLYLPLYRTNTSLMCPLAAAVETGDRGQQRHRADCPSYCADKAFFYPDEMKLIGRFNSLLGFSDIINDASRINAYISRGIGRLAVDL